MQKKSFSLSGTLKSGDGPCDTIKVPWVGSIGFMKLPR